MAQPTVQDVVDLARITLNDADKVRDSDPDLAKFVNSGLDEFYMLRPDLFIGSFTAAAASEGHQLELAEPLPIDGRWKQLLADYVVARAQTKDDEHVNSNRVALMLRTLEARLVE